MPALLANTNTNDTILCHVAQGSLEWHYRIAILLTFLTTNFTNVNEPLMTNSLSNSTKTFVRLTASLPAVPHLD
jgi:hypothetical protein